MSKSDASMYTHTHTHTHKHLQTGSHTELLELGVEGGEGMYGRGKGLQGFGEGVWGTTDPCPNRRSENPSKSRRVTYQRLETHLGVGLASPQRLKDLPP